MNEVATSVPLLLEYVESASHLDAERPLFIRLDPPTAESKMLLRVAVENAASLKGERRAKALRAIVPVISVQPQPSVDVCNQLDDDITYAQDNFGGIALSLDVRGLELVRKCTRVPH